MKAVHTTSIWHLKHFQYDCVESLCRIESLRVHEYLIESLNCRAQLPSQLKLNQLKRFPLK